MYTNMFDTVRTEGADILGVQSVLYTSIISGLHPLLALNQAVDNCAVIDLCQNHPELIDLIERNVIRVAPYKIFKDDDGHVIDPIMGYMLDNLKYPEEGSGKNPYIFSSLPFLNDPDKQDSKGVYDTKARREIYRRMRDVISGKLRYFTSNLDVDKKLPSMDPAHVHMIDQHLRTVRRIMEAAKGQYLPLRRNPPVGNTLSDRIKHYSTVYSDAFYGRGEDMSVSVEEEFVLALSELNRRMQNEKKKEEIAQAQEKKRFKVDERSNLYPMIDELQCNKQLTKELRSVVDLCYNEVVATSLNDNEEDLMVLNHGESNIELMMRHDDQDCMATGQKFLLMETADLRKGELSWEKLSAVLAQVQRKHPHPNEWKACMEDALRDHEIRNLTIAGQKYMTGTVKLAKSCFEFTEGIGEIMKESFTGNLLEGLRTGGRVLLKSFDLWEGRTEVTKIFGEAGEKFQDSKEYRDMQDLVVQANYLKHDYAQEDGAK